MLIYIARVWRRLRALLSYNELDLTNHSIFFKRGCCINCHKARCLNQRERASYWNFIIQWDKTSLAEIVRMTSLLTRLNQSEAKLIYFSLPSPYRVKTVFDHFPGNLFFFYILRENPKCFPSPVSISFIPSCPSFSKLPCGVGIGKTSTIPSSNDSSKFADLKFPDTIPVEIRKRKQHSSSQNFSSLLSWNCLHTRD